MFKDLIQFLAVIATERPVLKDSISFFTNELLAIENQITNLQTENAKLKQIANQYHQQTAKKESLQDPFEYNGAVFNFRNGEPENVVFCFHCWKTHATLNSTSCLESFWPFLCNVCRWESPFTGKELPGILKKAKEVYLNAKSS